MAIDIDSLYLDARLNAIRFAYLKNDIELSIKNCHDLQKLYPNSPMFLNLEGEILETQNQKQKSKKLYKKALNIYENELYDELDNNSNLEIEYIQCLVLNNKNDKARARLEKLKANNKENNFRDLTIEILMEGHKELKKKINRKEKNEF